MQDKELLNRRVVTGGIELGRVVDVILGEEGRIAIGLEVLCGDGAHRFLPMAAVQIGPEGDVEIESPLTMGDELDFYKQQGLTLRDSLN